MVCVMPEKNPVFLSLLCNSFVFTQNLQRVAYIDPFIEAKNNFILRRVNTAEYRAINEGVNRKI